MPTLPFTLREAQGDDVSAVLSWLTQWASTPNHKQFRDLIRDHNCLLITSPSDALRMQIDVEHSIFSWGFGTAYPTESENGDVEFRLTPRIVFWQQKEIVEVNRG